jgi:predicted RNase H-like nuclease (RuvC/YqgF family)
MPLHDLCSEEIHHRKGPELQIMNDPDKNFMEKVLNERAKREALTLISEEIKGNRTHIEELKEMNAQMKAQYEQQIKALEKLANIQRNPSQSETERKNITDMIQKKERLLKDIIEEKNAMDQCLVSAEHADNIAHNDDIDKSIIEPPALIIPKRGSIKKNTAAKAWK